MKIKIPLTLIAVTIAVAGLAGIGSYLALSQLNPEEQGIAIRDPLFGWKIPVDNTSGSLLAETARDPLFGWKYPTTGFPDVGSEDNKLAYSDIRDPGGIAQGLPVRLKIPVIGVNSAIEDAFITPEGRMDVPSGSRNVAWFALGPNPGQAGSAVIGGHFGIRDGIPFVFYDLDKLAVGDKVYIEDDKGDTLAFQVRKIELFGRDDDATTVFTSNDGLAHLNLITCEGIWNKVNDSYPSRRVVFTDAIPNEVPSNEASSASVVPKENSSVSVVPKDSLIPEGEPAQQLILPSTALDAITLGAPAPDAPEKISRAPWSSLFTTPLDIVITSLLLFLIVFMIIAIIRLPHAHFVK